ncbi:cbb3-type cytochrome oxidase subunit 3 [Arthrobacter sp. B3I9]|nr:cbb3-type cytochrome oxidase subunit 3 [Arthrobacter sp. B3I9]
MPRVRRRSALTWIVVGLAIVFIAVVSLFLVSFYFREPAIDVNTLEYEVAKTFLQVAGVILFGAFVAISTFLFQQEWTQRRENQRRESDRLHDERERQDLALRSLLTQTLEAYNGVKRIRRILRAEGLKTISAEVYKQQLLGLNDLQLTFEYLKIDTSTMGDERLLMDPSEAANNAHPRDLQSEFKDIETYLNLIFKEFEQNLRHVEEQGTVELWSLGELNSFLTDTRGFRAGVSEPFHRIVLTLQKALMVPLDLPRVGQNSKQS